MTPIQQWARKHDISDAALADMPGFLLAAAPKHAPPRATPRSEADVQSIVRVKASQAGWRVFRNNVGAAVDAKGRHIRYGLGNDSKPICAVLKSSDLIGLRSRVIQPWDVGGTIAQFVALECKRPGWKEDNSPRTKAQRAFLQLVQSRGGHAMFTTGEIE
jgi:hypothetical protein